MHLPKSLSKLIDVIPQKAVIALVQRYGGRRLYVPKQFDPAGAIAKAIGKRSSHALARSCGGETIDVPRACSAHKALRDREIRALRANGKPMKLLVRLYGISERQLRRIVNEPAATHHSCGFFSTRRRTPS